MRTLGKYAALHSFLQCGRAVACLEARWSSTLRQRSNHHKFKASDASSPWSPRRGSIWRVLRSLVSATLQIKALVTLMREVERSERRSSSSLWFRRTAWTSQWKWMSPPSSSKSTTARRPLRMAVLLHLRSTWVRYWSNRQGRTRQASVVKTCGNIWCKKWA